MRGLEPESHSIIRISQRTFLGRTMCHAPRHLRNIGDVELVHFAPEDNCLVFEYDVLQTS